MLTLLLGAPGGPPLGHGGSSMKRRVLLVAAFLSLAIGVSPALTQQSGADDMVARIRTVGAAAVARARVVSNAHRRNRRPADGLPGSQTGGAVGARSICGMGTDEPASRAVGVRPRLAARTCFRGDDRAALFPVRGLRRGLVAVDQRRRERTSRVRRRQERCRRFRRWRHSFAAPSS